MKYTNDEIIDLIKRRSNLSIKEKIDEEILKDHLFLAEEIAKKYETKDFLYDDLYQEALISIMNNIDNYDYTKKISFIDFISRKIEKDILNYIENEKKYLIDSEHLTKKLNEILDAEDELYVRLKRFPYEDEVASTLNLSIDELREFKSYALEILGLVNNEENKSKLLKEIINSKDSSSDDDIDKNLKEAIMLSLNTLNDTEKDIISMYYGLNGIYKKSIDEICDIYEISSEKLRQLVKKIERKLKRQMEDNDD